MQNKCILIVEDDQGIREALRLTLEVNGYETLTADNGKAGIEILGQGKRPSLILLDLMMPVMNGWAFAEAISHDSSLADIPIIIVTAFPNRAAPVKNARGMIKKPIDIDLLLKTVEENAA